MNKPVEFNYDAPSSATLVGITLSVEDAGPTPQGPVESSSPSRSSEAAPPGAEDLFGITLTFDDHPGDAHLDNRPPQAPPLPLQPEQPQAGP